LRGEGEPGDYGAPAGDLFVVIHVKEHDFFVREGDHLLCEIPISFVQAALGDNIAIQVLGNADPHELKISPGTQPGDIISVPEFGMPRLQGNRRGDLYVKVAVKIPKKLTQRQRELLEAFSETEASKKGKKGKNLWKKIKKHSK
jgi:molecular chaperone DnaJ